MCVREGWRARSGICENSNTQKLKRHTFHSSVGFKYVCLAFDDMNNAIEEYENEKYTKPDHEYKTDGRCYGKVK